MSVINREMISKSIRFLNSFKEGDKYINTFNFRFYRSMELREF